jgi:methionine-rich copper-binding protein CopC
MNKFAKAFAALALAAAALLPAQAAFAHAKLESANPAADSVIGSAPEQVVLTFDEPLMVVADSKTANQIQVTNEAGDRVDQGDSKLDGAVLSVSLKSGLAEGKYKVEYRFVADDGHAEEANYSFEVSVAAQSGEATPMAVDDQSPVPVLYDANSAARTAKAPDANNGAAIGIGVAVGAVLIGGAMFFLFRTIRRSTQPAEEPDSETDKN